MQSSRHLSRVLFSQGCRRYSSNTSTSLPTMNEFPQPKGDWQTNYDALNRRYTLHLLLGVGVFIGTLVMGKAGGFLDMYNDYPEKPAVIDHYKTDKE